MSDAEKLAAQKAKKSEYNRRYYQENLERERIRKSAYYHATKDQSDREGKLQYLREYYRMNPEKYRKTPEQQERHNSKRREQYRASAEVRAARGAEAAAYRRRNPDRRTLTTYKLTAEELELLTDAGCGICGSAFGQGASPGKAKRHVDHDHRTGSTRGVLCQPCNLALGHLQDDPIIAAAALRYLLAGGTMNGPVRGTSLFAATTS